MLAGWSTSRCGPATASTPRRRVRHECFDCAALGGHADAVAVCADCGAAVCPDHAHVTARRLTRTMVINRVVAVEPPARTIRCAVCQAARDTADPYSDAQASSGR